jgi:uncharacterized protein (DUF58 family)
VRQLVDSSLPRTTILLDTRAGAYREDSEFELAVDIAASVALAAARLGFPIAVLTPEGQFFTAKGGRAEATVLLDRLALIRTGDGGSLAAMIEAARRGYAGGSLSVVTGAPDPVELERLAAVRARFDRTVLIRTGRRPPPLPAGMPVTTIDSTNLTGFAVGWRQQTRSAAGRGSRS